MNDEDITVVSLTSFFGNLYGDHNVQQIKKACVSWHAVICGADVYVHCNDGNTVYKGGPDE